MLTRRTIARLTASALSIEHPGASTCLTSCHRCCPRRAKSACHEAPWGQLRRASSASSKRWQSRQGRDAFSRAAKVQGLKSRAAFKLLEINEKYKVLKRGQTVVDLGFAPGSWTEVAVNRTAPNGRVLGIDIIPAKPPKGASAIQGNFLSPAVQEEVKQFLRDPKRGRPRSQKFFVGDEAESDEVNGLTEAELEEVERGYIDIERHASVDDPHADPALEGREDGGWRRLQKGPVPEDGRMVDVVLSDMSDPWPQTSGYHIRSLSAPYSRMMNTSGISFRDHAGSMDLCLAALRFCFDTLRPGGHFVCKFYQGAEDKALETKLRRLFTTVHREKPEASRSLSKEGFFVALRREKNITLDELFRERSG